MFMEFQNVGCVLCLLLLSDSWEAMFLQQCLHCGVLNAIKGTKVQTLAACACKVQSRVLRVYYV